MIDATEEVRVPVEVAPEADAPEPEGKKKKKHPFLPSEQLEMASKGKKTINFHGIIIFRNTFYLFIYSCQVSVSMTSRWRKRGLHPRRTIARITVFRFRRPASNTMTMAANFAKCVGKLSSTSPVAQSGYRKCGSLLNQPRVSSWEWSTA